MEKGLKKFPQHEAANHTKGPSRPQALLLDTDICGTCSRAKSNTPQQGLNKVILQLCVEMQTRVLEAIGWQHHLTCLRLCLVLVLMSLFYFQFQKTLFLASLQYNIGKGKNSFSISFYFSSSLSTSLFLSLCKEEQHQLSHPAKGMWLQFLLKGTLQP